MKGLARIQDGVFLENPPEIIEDLDALPLPAYSASLHADHAYGNLIFTGRGVPTGAHTAPPAPASGRFA